MHVFFYRITMQTMKTHIVDRRGNQRAEVGYLSGSSCLSGFPVVTVDTNKPHNEIRAHNWMVGPPLSSAMMSQAQIRLSHMVQFLLSF